MTPPNNDERDLLTKFEQGGAIDARASRPYAPLRAALLSACIRKYSKRMGKAHDCDSVRLEGFTLQGELDLSNLGLEGAPLLGLELTRCNLVEGLSLDYAYIKSLVLDESKIGFIKAMGLTVIDMLQLTEITTGPNGSIDFSETRLKGGVYISGLHITTCKCSEKAALSFARAIVGSDLLMEGLRSQTTCSRAFDGEELQVAGTLRFRRQSSKTLCTPQFCNLKGELHLRGAKIGGQLLLEGVTIVANQFKTVVEQDEETASVGQRPTLALMAEGATVGGDVFFREDVLAPNHKCHIMGQVNIAGTHIGGELDIYGTYEATDQHIRAFRAQRVHIGGDLRFGWLPGHAHDTHSCNVTGECDFSEATVLGKVIFSGSQHKVSLRYKRPKGVERKRKQAVDLRYQHLRRSAL